MSIQYRFRVAGIPATHKNNKIAKVVKGKPIIFTKPEITAAMNNIKAIALQAQREGDLDVIQGDFELYVTVYANNKKKDLDGVVSVVLDALNLVCYTDDQNCIMIYAVRKKIETPPYIEVVIKEKETVSVERKNL